MTNELNRLIELFRTHGGKLKNVEIGYRDESGYFCAAINNAQEVEIYCPEHLLVRSEDIGINELGLYVTKPEKYSNNIDFIEKYLSFHFNKRLVDKTLEEEQQLESLSVHERKILTSIHMHTGFDGASNSADAGLELVKKRILQHHQLLYSRFGASVIMPFITFANHDWTGTTIKGTEYHGVAISGKFKDEVFARYSDGDALMLLNSYGFVADTPCAYSIPMWFQLPDGRKVEVHREVDKYTIIDQEIRLPTLQKTEDGFIISWFPLFSNVGPYYPARIASYIAQNTNIPGEVILQLIFSQNLRSLLPVIYELQKSNNNYLKLVVSAVKRQLNLIAGVR